MDWRKRVRCWIAYKLWRGLGGFFVEPRFGWAKKLKAWSREIVHEELSKPITTYIRQKLSETSVARRLFTDPEELKKPPPLRDT